MESVVAEPRTAEGRRNSAADLALIQEMHDRAMSLGAVCREDQSKIEDYREFIKPELKLTDAAAKSSCGCGTTRATHGSKGDTRMTKAERIRALIDSPKTCFTADDQAMLDTATEERLTAMETHVSQMIAEETNFKAASEATQRELSEIRAAAAKVPTEEEYLQRAPASIRALVERQRQADAEQKASLVAALRTAQSEFTEDELNTMGLAELSRLSRVAKATVAAPVVDYSARGIRVAETVPTSAVPPAPDFFAAIRAAKSH
jgi:hypothetical protein